MRLAIISLLILIYCLEARAQSDTKRPLSHSDYDNWKSLSKPAISNNGKWIAFEINPQKGDGKLFITTADCTQSDSVSRGQGAVFSSSSDLVVFAIKQPEDTIRKLKLAKKKKDEMPKDSLGMWLIEKDSILRFSGLKSFGLPRDGGPWVAFLYDKPIETVKDTLQKAPADSVKAAPEVVKVQEKPKKKKKSAFDEVATSNLLIINPVSNHSLEAENASEFAWSRNGCLAGYITLRKNETDTVAVFIYDTHRLKTEKIFEKQGYAKKLSISNQGNLAVFLFTADTGKVKRYSLVKWDINSRLAEVIADTSTAGIPAGNEVNENATLTFSDDETKLFFGTAPKVLPQPKDTVPDDEKTKLDIWHYRDPRLQSQQLKELDDDLKRSYLAVYRIRERKIIQLADSSLPNIKTYRRGNAEFVLGSSDLPYQILSSWDDADYKDYYYIDLASGTRKLLLEKHPQYADLSPEGRYLLFYQPLDSSWYTLEIASGRKRKITQNLTVPFYNELFDMPSSPGPYGIAGWSEKDANVLIYDRYDLWMFDPAIKNKPENLTETGRTTHTSFRYVKLDPDAYAINLKKPLLIKTTDEETCDQGFAELTLGNKKSLIPLIAGEFEYSSPVKSRDAEVLIWQKSNYRTFPDLWSSDIRFNNTAKVSGANPQQAGFKWGTVEPVKWTSPEGKQLSGLLYKPDDFNPANKYPLIVYFYERYSDKRHAHYPPSPSRSVINFTLYNSNDYLVFVPDIVYGTGHPGNDAYNAVISGTRELMKQPWVDSEHMGLQGQSWGGYQVAFMITRTGLFKAAMAGAAVSNMTSAYGGIRWESGVVRQFQYEKSQSRIGGTLWDSRDLFIENSPVFFADRITTPLLMMNNDNDGAVPWYQGIELFTALRRLGKPAWMLNYNGDEHNLTKRPNRQDLSVRMMQFFDHYLKDAPEPQWMKQGIPAVNKGKNLAY